MIKKRILIPIIFLSLTGCTTPPSETPIVEQASATPSPFPPTATSRPPTDTSTPSPIPPTATPLPTSTPTASPIPPELPCSPLVGYEFVDFRLITARGFTAATPGKDDGHQAIDLSHYAFKEKGYIEGESIGAMYSGTIAAVVNDRWPYGNMVIVETPLDRIQLQPDVDFAGYDAVYHLYAHMLETPVWAVGDEVNCGDVLGLVGNTGRSGNAHLHLETRLGARGQTFDSLSYYLADSTPAEQAEYLRWRVSEDFLALDPILFWSWLLPE